MKKIKLNKRDVVALILLTIIVIGSFAYVLYRQIQYYFFATDMENLYSKNENPVFCIEKIVMFSSANAIDNSEGQTLQDLNICQFTDIAIYIDNMADINTLVKESDAMGVSIEETNDEASRKIKEHTIKELYIDNIKIEGTSARGIKTLTYKSPLRYGKFKTSEETDQNNDEEKKDNNQNIVSEEQPNRIDFEIISNNVDNERSDYTKPTFYADCSNPLTLSYMNKDIVKGYAVSAEDTQIKFDGSILQSVGINLADIACSISFDIHLKNNLDQNFACSIGLDIPLSSENKNIYSGYMYIKQDELQNQYRFFKN